jgi:hypothetical protein
MEQEIKKVESQELQIFSQEVLKVYADDVIKCHRQTIKIRDYSENSKWRKVRMALAECAMIIGNKTAPNDMEYFVLKKLLIDEFGDYSPEEILVAFYKLSSGRLEVKSESYGKMSAKYLGEVLVEYRKYRHKQIAERNKIDEREKRDEVVIVQDEEKVKIRKIFLEQCFMKPYNEMKSTGVNRFDNHNALMFFMMLFKRGQIMISDEVKGQYRELAIESLKNDAKMEFNKRALRELVESLKLIKEEPNKSLENRIKERACVLYFFEYIKQIIANGTNVRQWLTDTGMYNITKGE